MGKFLDKTGLQTLWNALKGKCVLINKDGSITLKSKDNSLIMRFLDNVSGSLGLNKILNISVENTYNNIKSVLELNSVLGVMGLNLDVYIDNVLFKTVGINNNSGLVISSYNGDKDYSLYIDLNEFGQVEIVKDIDGTSNLTVYKLNFDKAVELGVLSVSSTNSQALNLESLSADELAKLSPSQLRKMTPSQLVNVAKKVRESRANDKSDAQVQVTP